MTDARNMDCGSVASGDEVECPGCGRVLPETTDQHWEVTDGDPLGCGCAGCWSADGEHADPVHDDLCLRCARDEIEDLRARLAKATECRSVDVEEAIRKLDMAVAVCTEPAVLCLINDTLRVLGVDFEDTEQESVDHAAHDVATLRKIEGMFEAVGPDLIEAIETLRGDRA